MKKIFCFYFFVFLLLTLARPVRAQQLIPAPKKLTMGQGRFLLHHASLQISGTGSAAERQIIERFIDDIREASGVRLPFTDSVYAGPLISIACEHPEDNGLALPDEKAGAMSKDWYHIRITAEKLTVNARTNAGLIYALQSLRQLVKTEAKSAWLPEADLEDYPAFAYRGVMMDLSHGGLLTEAEIKRQIDFLSRWKINQYYLYNEVSIEMKGYPLLNGHGGYTREQIKSIIAFGRERAVDVIPFVNFYGHLHELLRIQKYAGLGIGKYGHDLDPRKPEVQSLLQDWIQQYASLFPSPFIHIGFDETWETKRLSLKDKSIRPEKLYIDHLDFVSRELAKYGKTPMVWTDISKSYPDVMAAFPRKIIPVIWDYGEDPASVNNWIRPVLKTHLPFFMQSAVDGWAHIYPTETSWGNIDLCLKAAEKNDAAGYITSVWTDAIQPLLRNTWLFMAYGAAVSWSGLPLERTEFIRDYCLLVYPSIAKQMQTAFTQLSESQVHLRKCLGQTQTHMWENPFLSDNLRNTNQHLADFEQARLAAETAEESLMAALARHTADTAFLSTLLLNSRLLSYTAMRFLWAKKMSDRWNESMRQKDDSWYADIAETPHGLIMDMLDYNTEIRDDYELAWRSENIPYRLGTIRGRFDAEYAFWRRLSENVLEFHYHASKMVSLQSFARTFRLE